jgi:hypothetical protein
MASSAVAAMTGFNIAILQVPHTFGLARTKRRSRQQDKLNILQVGHCRDYNLVIRARGTMGAMILQLRGSIQIN